MPRPQIVRADTIDLQDPESPSAKDHTKQPTTPNALGDGPPAPHQAATLKSSGIDSLELHSRSPRASQDLSTKELQLLHDHADGDETESAEGEGAAGQRNVAGEDGDVEEESEGAMEDDMMDKISSSPSIDDGGYRHDRTSLGVSPSSPAKSSTHSRQSSGGSNCSSPYTETPEHLPLTMIRQIIGSPSPVHHHLHPGRYGDESDSRARSESPSDDFRSCCEDVEPTKLEHLDFEDHITETNKAPMDNSEQYSSFNFGFESQASQNEEPTEEAAEEHVYSPWDYQENWPSQRSLSPSSVDLAYAEESSSDEDDDTEDSWTNDPRFIVYGWSARCLRDAEDIDFEFVYALHTFVATVEGQANATKGDTMVLLDDSNSYWWLVRVVKDNSIGYLPAEHIETPTERLARLNKHRNIDLSQTMLGDNPEKFKNPLKKAMRRRNAKTVSFAEPTYFEASENEYSSEEENEEELDFITSATEVRNEPPPEQQIENSIDAVEPLKIREAPKENGKVEGPKMDMTQAQPVDSVQPQEDRSRGSAEVLESQDENIVRSNRRMRNTDSFFKDDSVEPKKINLTPSLLRDDSTPSSNSFEQSRSRGSLESAPKSPGSEKGKDDKRKEKKRMLGGLFKRRERKSKTQTEDDDMEWLAKETGVNRQSPQPKVSSESVPSEPTSTPSSPQKNQPVRQTSKLQKNPPSKSNSFNRGSQKSVATEPISMAPQLDAPQQTSPLTNPFENLAGGEVIADRTAIQQKPTQQTNPPAPSIPDEQKAPTDSRGRDVLSPFRDVLRATQPSSEPKPEKLKKATTRMMLEDSDESQDDVLPKTPGLNDTQREVKAPSPTKDNLSESPVHVAPVLGTGQPTMVGDSSSSQEGVVRSVDSSTSSPELVERPTEEAASGAEDTTATPTSTAQSSKPSKPEFNWARCQRWFDEDFPSWYTLIMDPRDAMKDFNWKEHWTYKEYCKEYMDSMDKMQERCKKMMVDLWDVEDAKKCGYPRQHPEFACYLDEEWWAEIANFHEKVEGKKRGEYWLPWEDPEYAYLFPHRSDRAQGPHVPTGPPENTVPRRKPGEPSPKYWYMLNEP